MTKIKKSKNEPKKKRGRPPKNQEKQQEQPKKEDKETKKNFTWDEDDSGMQRGLLALVFFGIALVAILSFVDQAAAFGVWTEKILGWVFGWGRYFTPVIFAVLGYVVLHPERYQLGVRHIIGIVLFLLSGLGLLHLFVPLADFVEGAGLGKGGGYLGIVLSFLLVKFTGIWATIIILFCLFVGSVLIMFNISLPELIRLIKVSGFLKGFTSWARSRFHAHKNGYRIETDDSEEDDFDDDEEGDFTEEDVPEEESSQSFSSKEVSEPEEEFKPTHNSEDLEQMAFIPKKRIRRTKIDLPLSLLTDRNEKPTSGDIEANKEKIQKALESFGIDVEMGVVSVGPMVSQYTLRPHDGVKLTQITTLHNDISLALAAHPIRIEAPIPGRSLVGIEVPNKAIATVTVKEMLASKKFKQRKDNLSVCLGKDVSGKPYIASIQKMPHLLIAGATGSGKSVCINGIIVSLLYQNSPDDLKLILVDPKRVELSVYDGIPHLLTPVITDVEKTVNALKWTVAEMDRRYDILSSAGKRSIESYNEAVPEDSRMPYIIFMIDELADLMSVAANSVEAAIVRLAQMSRAVGIHLVLATQRPSVNVLTGLIKANMPARIAFSVASLVDSRTILDFSGAEKLIGRGDMLFIDANLSKPKRLQGAFLDDHEIENIVTYLKDNADPDYNQEVTEQGSKSDIPSFHTNDDGGSGSDDLLDDAKEVIISAKKASASLLQRRLRIGYARAARILDILEEQGFIGPADGAKPREILVNPEEVEEPEESEHGDESEEYVEEDSSDSDQEPAAEDFEEDV